MMASSSKITSFSEDLPYPAWILSIDDMQILWANQSAEEWLGRSVVRQQGRKLYDFLDLGPEVISAYKRCAHNDNAVIIRGQSLETVQSQRTACHLSFFPSNGAVGLMLQVAASQPNESNGHVDAMSAMGRMLAHEIKNPLAGMSGAVQLLRPDVSGTEANDLLDLIGSEIDRIRRLADRMETLGDKDPERTSAVNMHELLHRAVMVMSSEKDRKVKFEEKYDPSLPAIQGDEDSLMQAVLNIVKNAVEAIEMSNIGETVKLSTTFRSGVRRRRTQNGKTISLPIEVRVEDNGPGMPAAIRDQIFQPFVSNKPTGEGLGLAVVSKIIAAHGGIIEMNSDPGRTVFSILLPLDNEVPA